LRLKAVEEKGEDLLVHFDGSDAGEGYHGYFVVQRFRVVRREIWHAEFPELGPEIKHFSG
jgi:hypothetical protein